MVSGWFLSTPSDPTHLTIALAPTMNKGHPRLVLGAPSADGPQLHRSRGRVARTLACVFPCISIA